MVTPVIIITGVTLPVIIGLVVAAVLCFTFGKIADSYKKDLENDHTEINHVAREIKDINKKLEAQSAQPINSLTDSTNPPKNPPLVEATQKQNNNAEPTMHPPLFISGGLNKASTPTPDDIAPPPYASV